MKAITITFKINNKFIKVLKLIGVELLKVILFLILLAIFTAPFYFIVKKLEY